MADKMPNRNLTIKRLELQRHEQLLTQRRQELRLLELEEERAKIEEALVNTKANISEIEKSMTAEGIKF